MKIIDPYYTNDENGQVTVTFMGEVNGARLSGRYTYEGNTLMSAEDVVYFFLNDPDETVHTISVMDSYPWWEVDLSEEESDILNSVRNWIDTRVDRAFEMIYSKEYK